MTASLNIPDMQATISHRCYLPLVKIDLLASTRFPILCIAFVGQRSMGDNDVIWPLAKWTHRYFGSSTGLRWL
jgi:hypothetical protein